MNQNKIYLISGVSGVGKTSTLEYLKKILPENAFNMRDFDERGVPNGGGALWHNNETRYWLDVATQNALIGKSTVISGFTNPEQFKKIYDPKKDISSQMILLDVNPEVLKKRLYNRHMTPENKKEIERASGTSLDEFVEQCSSFAPQLRLIFEQNNLPIINTDDKTPEEVAREVVKIILPKSI